MDDVEDGLGPIKVTGFQTPNGRRFALIQYLKAPNGPAIEITCLHDEKFAADLDEVLDSLDMDLSDVVTTNSGKAIVQEVLLIPHNLWREDDNGVRTLMGAFPCRADASKKMRSFEATAHKQAYWVEPCSKTHGE
jgi:hypothetical protein